MHISKKKKSKIFCLYEYYNILPPNILLISLFEYLQIRNSCQIARKPYKNEKQQFLRMDPVNLGKNVTAILLSRKI